MYDALPIGITRKYKGQEPQVFITDTDGTTANNSGSLDVEINFSPKPGTSLTRGVALGAYVAKPPIARLNPRQVIIQKTVTRHFSYQSTR